MKDDYSEYFTYMHIYECILSIFNNLRCAKCNAHPLGEADVLQNVLDEELGATVWISAATRLQRLHQWQYFGWPVHSRRARKDKVPHPVLSHHLRDATDNCQDV